jgi:hypothetical protein
MGESDFSKRSEQYDTAGNRNGFRRGNDDFFGTAKFAAFGFGGDFSDGMGFVERGGVRWDAHRLYAGETGKANLKFVIRVLGRHSWLV